MMNYDNETKLRTYLKTLDDCRTMEYLWKLYPEQKYSMGCDGRNYDMFIEYMMQGFNRKRGFLMEHYDLSREAINTIAFKNQWTSNAEVWEKRVVDNFIQRMFPPRFSEDAGAPWVKRDDESYYQYFCFLCYLFLNDGGSYSQPRTASILSEEGVRVVGQTLNLFSSRFGWLERCRQYYISSVAGERNDCGAVLKVLESSCVGNLVDSFVFVWDVLRDYGISDEEYVGAFNTVVQTTVDDCEENGVYGSGWISYFDSIELLEELLVYRIKIDSHDFTDIFDKYTDKSTSEINELIIEHCYCFDESLDDYKFYSSALVDL